MMVLQPILKSSSSKVENLSPRVKFNLPTNDGGIIKYLTADDSLSKSSKLHSVTKLLTSPETDDSLIIQWLSELKDNILFLDRENETIAYSLLGIPWYTKSKKFIAAYQEFILNLVTAHPHYFKLVLTMFIKIFLSGIGSKESIEDSGKLHAIHMILKNVLELVPMSQHIFFTMLNERFPYIKNSSNIFLSYIQNMLRVCSYIPTKRSFILQCIIEKLIHIDVHCSRETITAAEERAEEQDEMIENMDTESTVEKKLDEMAYPFAHTLDVLMDCLFRFIKFSCFTQESNELNWEATKKLYKELLTIFDKIILPSQEICHVQYLMFYICSLRQELCDGFIDYLWKKVQDPNAGFVYRQMATFYIGSLLSRAKYISINTVTDCFDLMVNWIHRYIDAQSSKDVGVHGTFHSVCQTIFYIFAFRNKELLEMPNAYKYLRNLNFDRIVTCRLNPLKYCDKTIVQNFASIARNHQIAYVYPVIEKNNRSLLYCTTGLSSESTSGALIPTFFPFDPYLLKRSKQWIEPLYRVYNHGSKEEESLADQVEEDDMCVNEDLFTYSTSPGFKRIRSFLRDVHN